MFDLAAIAAALSKEPLAAVTAIATVLLFAVTGCLFIATWRAATVAKQNADIVAREFRLRRRPLVDVEWRVIRSESDKTIVFLYAKINEVSGVPTMLRSLGLARHLSIQPCLPR